NSTASGTGSTALGENSTASGLGTTALGQFSTASGAISTALGESSTASGERSTALGRSSTASGERSTALGYFSRATFSNSTAIGANSATTRDDQMVFGTATNTYTAPGITSGASRAAQTGPREIVTSDASGNLATDTPAGLGLATTTDTMMLRQDIDRNAEGVAMAMAMSGIPSILPVDATYGISANYGTFGGENAMAIGGAVTLTESLFFSGGGAIGMGGNGTSGGGRAGFTFIR
ncbi:MAG: hypothetical protein KDB05_19160, partial [Planctomycetales bacterium]|nr:hypothetical protein [Planctomycetales bacterium]